MTIDENTAGQRYTAIRMVLGSLGTLIVLLIMLAVIRPDMAMNALHHMEAMVGMDAGTAH